MPKKDGTLQAREFVFFCEDQVMAALPVGFPRPQRRVMWTILQLFYGDPTVHFELQPMVGRGQLELGLHFEGALEANEAGAAKVSERAIEIMAALGPDWELEVWTASWRRLHRVFHFTRLDVTLAREVAAQMLQLMLALQPVLGESAVHYEPPVRVIGGKSRSERWRSRSKARR
jgi:hypothetical protein